MQDRDHRTVPCPYHVRFFAACPWNFDSEQCHKPIPDVRHQMINRFLIHPVWRQRAKTFFKINFSARVPDSQRSARMSEIYCQLDNLSSNISDEFHGAFDKFSVDSLQNDTMTHTHDSSENETLENECAETHSIVDTLTMSSLATNFTLGMSDDDSSEMTNDDFILKILNRIIDIALSTVEKQVTFKLMLTRWRSSSTF